MNFVSKIGVLGQKLGMSRLIMDNMVKPVTIVKIPVNHVIEKIQKDDHVVLKLGVEEFKKRINKPQLEEYKKKGIAKCSLVKEFKILPNEAEAIESNIDVSFFEDLQYVDVAGKSMGKGFAGGMKLWGFKGQKASHGASLSHRSIGSIGTRDKNWKGKKMPGRMGHDLITVQNLKVLKIDKELGIIALHGAVPGKKGTWLNFRKSIKKVGKVS